jgi:spore germination protein KA
MSSNDKNKRKDKKRIKSPYKPHKSSQELTVQESSSSIGKSDEQNKEKNSVEILSESTNNDQASKNENEQKSKNDSSSKKEKSIKNIDFSKDTSSQTIKKAEDDNFQKKSSDTEESNNKSSGDIEEQPTDRQESKEKKSNSTDVKDKNRKDNTEQQTSQESEKQHQEKSEENSKKENPKPLSASLDANIRQVKEVTGESQDIVIRQIRFGEDQKLNACFFFTEGLTDTSGLHQSVLEPLMVFLKERDWRNFDTPPEERLSFIEQALLPIGGVSKIENFDELFTFMLSGEVIFLMQGFKKGFRISLKSWKDRGIPEAEGVVRGPRETFSETMRTNTALLRRKINNPRLRLEGKTIGDITKTQISLMFIDGIVDSDVLDEVRRRLDKIDIDGILESGYIEELIQDEPYSPFPTIHHTEKPDVVAAALLEGRVAIIVDGTPIVLLVPALFNQFFQAAEDYYERSLISSLIRILRFICLFISLLAPAVYIAVTTFHQEMVPTPLLVNLMVQREAVPFPAFVEAFLMELMFEILREAGVRLPKAVGQTVSFVGALVIGQAAVEAGIVSAGMVIVVAITAISNFVIPAYNMSIALRILRFILMMIAAGFGLYGVMIGLIVIVLHLCSIRSFGIPYMTPYGPYISSEFKDSIVRVPHWMMDKRPVSMVSQDVVRGNNSPPTKPNKKGKN